MIPTSKLPDIVRIIAHMRKNKTINEHLEKNIFGTHGFATTFVDRYFKFQEGKAVIVFRVGHHRLLEPKDTWMFTNIVTMSDNGIYVLAMNLVSGEVRTINMLEEAHHIGVYDILDKPEGFSRVDGKFQWTMDEETYIVETVKTLPFYGAYFGFDSHGTFKIVRSDQQTE